MLAEALEDERLADLLEELDEDEQVRLIENLDPERVGRVLDEMEADDAADLLGEMSADEQAELLAAMDPEEAEPVRRLLVYKPDTAGGLMTPEPVILGPNETVSRRARALARPRSAGAARRPRCLSASRRWRRRPGRFLGVVGIQRLLREAPSKPIGRCIDEGWDPVNASRLRPRRLSQAGRLQRRRDSGYRRLRAGLSEPSQLTMYWIGCFPPGGASPDTTA